jgi:hypothetical protein
MRRRVEIIIIPKRILFPLGRDPWFIPSPAFRLVRINARLEIIKVVKVNALASSSPCPR